MSKDEVRDEAIEIKFLRKEDLPEYRKHAHFKGTEIGINEATKEFKVPYVTIYRWMKSGVIAQ